MLSVQKCCTTKVLAPEPLQIPGQSWFLCFMRSCNTAGGKDSPWHHQAQGNSEVSSGELQESRRGQGGKKWVSFPVGWRWSRPPPPCSFQLFLVLGKKGKPFSWGDAKGRRRTEHSEDGLSHLWLDHKTVETNGNPSGTPDFMLIAPVAKHGSSGPGQEWGEQVGNSPFIGPGSELPSTSACQLLIS